MEKKFKYDVSTLIEAVESKPCLWDKSNEDYRQKIIRRNAWEYVAMILEPEYKNLQLKQQEELINHINDKWTRIRDCFKRSLKTTSGQSTKKKYIYSEMLQFLLKNMTPDETESSISSRKDDSEDDHSTHSTPSSIQPSTNKRVKMNPVDKEILNAIRSKSPKNKDELVDDDHAFLMSLLPTIKNIFPDDKMDFRIEVMQVVNKYCKRNRNPFHIEPSPQQSTCSNLSVNANNIASPESPYSSNSYIPTPRQYTESSVNIASTSTSNTYLVESPGVYQRLYPNTSATSDETQVATSSIQALLNQNFDQ